MKNLLKKISFIMTWISIPMMVCMLIFSSTAFAADEEEDGNFLSEISEDLEKRAMDSDIDGQISIGRCVAKGNIDFILFLQAVIYSDGFWEGVWEPFVDVFARNQCHVIDVSGLIKQRDKIRSEIRHAFLSCKNDRIPNLKRAYHEVNAEIYYVRHVVDGSIVLALPYQLLSTRMLEDEESLYYPKEKLYEEMKERYVGELMSDIEFDVFFNNLDTRYRERKKGYVICESSAWEEVAEKWAEFVESAGGIGPALDEGEKRIGGRAEKIYEAATDQGLKDYLSGIVQFKINGQDSATGAGDIIDSLSYIGASPEYTPTTIDFALSEIGEEEFRFNTELLQLDMSSKFSVLYKDTSDESIEFFVNELRDLNEVILNTLDPMDQVLGCVEMMNSRQCPN